ncbi:hypothetical protein [Streptomyces sp. NPDC052015]|uniref:hypothetical protein n=1 Tax=Streptomyces sp. NPDC052015 TaxID=3154755 RepID=UPI0034155D05
MVQDDQRDVVGALLAGARLSDEQVDERLQVPVLGVREMVCEGGDGVVEVDMGGEAADEQARTNGSV